MNPIGKPTEGDSGTQAGSAAPGEAIAGREATAMPHAGSEVRSAQGTPVPAGRIASPGPITDVAAELAVLQARRLFERTLAAWVVDLLALRRAGLDRPAWNAARQRHFWRKAA